MSDGYLGQAIIEKHCVELTYENTQPVHSTTYYVESKAWEFEKVAIEKMPLQKIIESAQTEWLVLIVFSPKK